MEKLLDTCERFIDWLDRIAPVIIATLFIIIGACMLLALTVLVTRAFVLFN